MNPEERSLLERTYAISQENNEILKVMNRSRKFGLIFKIAYWTIIIGLSVGAFYFIQPLIDSIGESLGITGGSQQTSTSDSVQMFKDLLGK